MFKGSCDIVVCYVLSVKIVSFIGICHTMFVLQFGNLSYHHPKLIHLYSFFLLLKLLNQMYLARESCGPKSLLVTPGRNCNNKMRPASPLILRLPRCSCLVYCWLERTFFGNIFFRFSLHVVLNTKNQMASISPTSFSYSALMPISVNI